MPAARNQETRDASSKNEIGARIKRLRKEAGLRQWQLAEMIGATQPAIHMYERGVLPEPRRLLQLAKIGGTTVEWILTGRHWEDGSQEMRRPSSDVCALAWRISEFSEEDRQTLEEATRILSSALRGLEKAGARQADKVDIDAVAANLREQPQATLSALSAALKIHDAARSAILAQGTERLKRSGIHSAGADPEAPASSEAAPPGPGKRRGGSIRPSSLEPLRGHIFRLDGELLVIRDILGDRNLRAELEETLARMKARLKSGKSADSRSRKSQR